MDSKESWFEKLSDNVRNCHRCEGLNIPGLTESAPGFGNLWSKVVIIGQSLCTKCMKTQIPFTGGSGRLLDNAFEIAGLFKTDVFITNVVHCHTLGNRKSFPHEISSCRDFLLEELRIVEPKAVIPLGQDAVISILGIDAWPASVGKRVARPHYFVYPMYHPSYVLKKGAAFVQGYVNDLANILRREVVHSLP